MTLALPHIPDRTCLYAVGDIHGHLNKLRQLVEMIEQDARRHPDADKTLVFLGDYIDRGPESKGVIDYLLHGLPAGFTPVFLRGNHEDVCLRVLEGDVQLIAEWLQFGGAACLASYGVNPFRPRMSETPEILQAELAQGMPAPHRQFLENTVLSYGCGDYFFVHAGVRPGTALNAQKDDDLMWIREEFLTSAKNFGKIVVHGHTIAEQPDIRPNRIGIDTGAYATGHLTCLKLIGGERQFFTT